MKYVQSDKYNIAWFKLAECVSRGERERAMGVYRLLHHSLGDRALAAQLKGDLFLCFNEDTSAIEKYREAAELYLQENKYIESIAVYEHLLFLQPGTPEYIRALVTLYKNIEMPYKVIGHITVLIQGGSIDLAVTFAKSIFDMLSLADAYKLRKNIIFGLIQQPDAPTQKIEEQLQLIIQALEEVEDQLLLQQFLSELKNINTDYYDKACQFIKEDISKNK